MKNRFRFHFVHFSPSTEPKQTLPFRHRIFLSVSWFNW